MAPNLISTRLNQRCMGDADTNRTMGSHSGVRLAPLAVAGNGAQMPPS
jgi:hypothetical protein